MVLFNAVKLPNERIAMSRSVVFIVDADKVTRSQVCVLLLLENCPAVSVALGGVGGGSFTVTITSSKDDQDFDLFADNVRKYFVRNEALMGEYSPSSLDAVASLPESVRA